MSRSLSFRAALVISSLVVAHATKASGASPELVKLETADLFLPGGAKAPSALVVFAHNGGAGKEDWGDFPRELASKGYAVLNVGWTDFQGHAELSAAIKSVLEKQKGRIDAGRVAFIGGCHGCVKLGGLINAGDPAYAVKTAVFLAISEKLTLVEPHVPVLACRSSLDRLGEGYRKIQQEVLEKDLTEPKKVVCIEGTPHGNELVTDAGCSGAVRAEITAWLEEHL